MHKNILAIKLKELREASNMRMNQLARQVKIDPQVISKIEKGKIKSPRGEIIYKIAQVLNTTPEYLLYGVGLSKNDNSSINKIPILNNDDETLKWCHNDTHDIPTCNREYIFNPIKNNTKDIFALKINSDSMQSKEEYAIPKGSIAICKPSIQLQPNKFVLLYDKENQAIYIRQVILDGCLYLRPLNLQFSTKQPNENIEALAEILGFVKLLQ